MAVSLDFIYITRLINSRIYYVKTETPTFTHPIVYLPKDFLNPTPASTVAGGGGGGDEEEGGVAAEELAHDLEEVTKVVGVAAFAVCDPNANTIDPVTKSL